LSTDTFTDPPPALATVLSKLSQGACTPHITESLHKVLARDPSATDASPASRDRRLSELLQDLCSALPPARTLLADPDQLATVLSWAAVSDPALCMTLITHHVLCLGSMAQLAPDHHALADTFDALEAGRVKGGYLITEAGRSNSHLATRTEALYEPATQEFVLHTPDDDAAKFCGVSATGGARTVVVLARLRAHGQDRGVFSFVVDLTDHRGPLPGVTISSPIELGALPLDYSLVRFDGVRLPFAHWLRDSASLTPSGAIEEPLAGPDERLRRTLCVGQELWGTLPTVAAATSRQSAVLALRYARHRRTQGRLAPGAPLLSYRAHQQALLGAFAESFALTCAAARARELLTSYRAAAGDHRAAFGTDAMTFSPWAAVSRPLSAYKAHSVRTAARIASTCQRLCGYSGHLDANRLAGYHGFHHAFDAAGGDSQLIFYDLGQTLITEAEGSAPTPTDPVLPEPSDPAWLPAVLLAHEQRLVHRLRSVHDARAALGVTGFELWNPLLAQTGELGELHAARLASQDTARTLEGLPRDAAHATLTALAALNGVVTARRWAGSLLTTGTLRPDRTAAWEQTADEMRNRLLPRLPLIEEAFGHPAALVRAPLATDNYPQALVSTLSWHTGGPA
jgi:acyl-CoA oxidase